MADLSSAQRDSLHALSGLLLGEENSRAHHSAYCRKLDEPGQREFISLADSHHVSIRACLALADSGTPEPGRNPAWISELLRTEAARIGCALDILASVCQELEWCGFPVVVIKSLDHWPDLGTDLDLYTSGSELYIRQLMEQRFNARVEPQSWGDRLACKWNFRIPGLAELIEIHVGRLGQTGEQTRLGRALIERRTAKTFGGHEFMVPSPEDQIILAVLNRFYRHYYFRICDVANTVQLIGSQRIDFDRLKQECTQAGIRSGVSAYLAVVDQYYAHYRGEHLLLPAEILRAATFGVEKVYAHAGFLRIPLFPQGAALFSREFAKAIGRKDLGKSMRLGLLPPLAVAAGAKLRVTGSDKGIW